MSTASSPAPSPTPMRANRKTIETTCSICGGGFELAEMVYSCASCGGFHHAKCWDTHHSCARVEESIPVTEQPEAAASGSQEAPVPPPLPNNVESDERACPECGALIKKAAVKCRFCEAILDRRLDRPEMNKNYVKGLRLNWFVLLILCGVTQQIFRFIWSIRQAVWANKVGQSSSPIIVSSLALVFLVVGGLTSEIEGIKDMLLLWILASFICHQIGNFQVKRIMEKYYNSVEHAGLVLGGFMTFFFGPIYFQYHFNRIARDRESGSLSLKVTP